MTMGGAFLGGGVELVPAGSCKLVMEIHTEDGKNLATTFSVVGGGQTYTATAGADGRAEITVPSGVTYTVTTSATGYDGLTAQTVTGDSATIQYVRFEAVLPRVKKSGDTMTGDLVRKSTQYENNDFTQTRHVLGEYEFQDKNGVFSGYLRRVGSTATQYTQMGCVAKINDATVSSSVEAHILPDGTMYANAPSWGIKTVNGVTTGTNDESDKIVTLKMLSLDPKVVHTIGNEGINGQKSFITPIIDPQNQSGRVSAPNSNASATPYYKIASISMDNISAWDVATLTLDAEYGWSSTEHHAVTYRAIVRLGTDKVIEKVSLAKIWASGQAYATFLKEDHWFIGYNKTQKVIEIWVKLEFDQGNLNYRVRMSGRRHENFAKWTIHSGFTGTGVASLPSTDDGWVMAQAIDISNRMAYSTPSGATGQEIATADWSIGKFVQKSGDTMTGELRIYGTSAFTTLINTKANEFSKFIHLDNTSGTTEWVGVTQAKKWGTNGSQVELIALDRTTSVWKGIYIQNDNGTCIISGVTPSSTSDNSTKIPTTAWINTADIICRTAGNQFIGGEKVFTGKHVIVQKNPWFHFVNTGFTKGAPPSSEAKWEFRFSDSAEAPMTTLRNTMRTDGRGQLRMVVANYNESITSYVEIVAPASGDPYVTAPSTPSGATGNVIATADWVNSKLSGKNGLTEFTSWAELEALIKAGKRGDSFNVTMDFNGAATIIDATALSAEIHAYGHYHIDSITVSGGEITDAEMFGSGEVQFKVDGATKTFATTGFGRKKVISAPVWGFRTPSNGNMGYAIINNDGVTSCTGYYISI